MTTVIKCTANARSQSGASKNSCLAPPSCSSMRRCVAGPGFGLWRWQSGIGRHFEPAAGSVPYALATNALQGAPLGAVLRPACTPTSSQSPCPASPASQPGSRSHSFVALLGAGALQRRRPATLAPACNATTAAAATTCRPAGPGSDAAPACDLGPQHRNGGGSPSRADKQLQTQHLNSSAADSSGSSSWSGQMQTSYERNDGNGGGTGRQAQGGATPGQAAASVQLPPPHSGLEGRAWGRGAPPLRPGRLQVWWTPLDLVRSVRLGRQLGGRRRGVCQECTRVQGRHGACECARKERSGACTRAGAE